MTQVPQARYTTPTPNIVMILLESWRADTMNDQVSPRIAEFGRRSTVCREHFSSGNSTVAGIFKNYDFGVYARSNFKRHKLKETIFRGIPVIENFAGKTADVWDREMTDRMLAFLDDHQDGDQPFFLFGFYKASHFGYFYDEEHAKFQPTRELSRALVTGRKDPGPFLNDYRNSVFFDDNQVGRILDRLEASGLLDNTIVIITSDHAEEFNDNGADYWGHGSNFTRWQ
ncbi:MAG: sulfatase-like hydrolase/transferase, partial [Deltaproteobacteria bacterium]|nr:sulfatase-like hydrolase/transferase [Deltaproteobacteria bacterium]